MDGGADGAHQLAWGVFAVHTGNRLKISHQSVGIFGFTCVVAIDAQPVHLAATGDFDFADHGDVVFRLAGDYACAAANATRQVDDHTPFVFRGDDDLLRIKRQRDEAAIFCLVGLDFVLFFRMMVILKARDKNGFALIHAVVHLRASQGITLAG